MNQLGMTNSMAVLLKGTRTHSACVRPIISVPHPDVLGQAIAERKSCRTLIALKVTFFLMDAFDVLETESRMKAETNSETVAC